MEWNSLVLGILVHAFVCERVHGVQIEFYKNSYFKGLSYESSSTAKCTNTPAYEGNVSIYSIKTDTCLMVYYLPNCQSISRKFDLDNNDGWGIPVRSFHTCNDEIGGNQLNIDITQFYDYYNKPAEIPDILESYKDVCTCINVPQYVQKMTEWSINNYGNDFLAYFEPDCSEKKWNATVIPAGLICTGARCMHNYEKIDSVTNTKHKIQSIGPDPNSKYFNTSCKIFDTVRDNKNKLASLPKDLENLRTKDKELEKKIEDLMKENQALKENAAQSELKLEHMFRNLEDSFERLRLNCLIKKRQ